MSYPTVDLASPEFTSLLAPAQRLRITMVPCRLRFSRFGSAKALAPDQKVQAAEHLGIGVQSLTAAKKLLDPRHPAFRALTAVRGQIHAYWRSMTLPFPEPCVRLIRLEDVEAFNCQMVAYSAALREAAANLERHFEELKAEAARWLGALFDLSDYPATLLGVFAVHWDFPNLEPPQNLTWLSPAVHHLEEFRVQGQFEEAVRLAEQAFHDELARRVSHLCERLAAGLAGGSPRVFRDAAVKNLVAFLARYRRFHLRSDAQLDEMVELVHRTLQGVTPQRLRDHPGLRGRVAAQLAWVRAALAAMAGDRPGEGNRCDDPGPPTEQA